MSFRSKSTILLIFLLNLIQKENVCWLLEINIIENNIFVK